jgi:hypothetical protein
LRISGLVHQTLVNRLDLGQHLDDRPREDVVARPGAGMDHDLDDAIGREGLRGRVGHAGGHQDCGERNCRCDSHWISSSVL